MAQETTNLTVEIIENAKRAVDQYVTTTTGLFNDLKSAVDKLRASGFIGAASDGFETFFSNTLTPALTTNLTDTSSSLTKTVKDILTSIQEQLIGNVDTQLGNANENAGQAPAGN